MPLPQSHPPEALAAPGHAGRHPGDAPWAKETDHREGQGNAGKGMEKPARVEQGPGRLRSSPGAGLDRSSPSHCTSRRRSLTCNASERTRTSGGNPAPRADAECLPETVRQVRYLDAWAPALGLGSVPPPAGPAGLLASGGRTPSCAPLQTAPKPPLTWCWHPRQLRPQSRMPISTRSHDASIEASGEGSPRAASVTTPHCLVLRAPPPDAPTSSPADQLQPCQFPR